MVWTRQRAGFYTAGDYVIERGYGGWWHARDDGPAPTPIASCVSLDEAKQRCEEHAARKSDKAAHV